VFTEVKQNLIFVVTRAVAVVIFVPPEAPTTILTLLSLSNIIVGHIDESGLLPFQKKKVVCTCLHLNLTSVSIEIRKKRQYLSFILGCKTHNTWLNEVVGWRGNPKAISNVRRAEIIHLIIKDNPSWAWHHLRAKTVRKQERSR